MESLRKSFATATLAGVRRLGSVALGGWVVAVPVLHVETAEALVTGAALLLWDVAAYHLQRYMGAVK